METSKQKIKTFHMFSGNAEEAMNFYISLFDDSSFSFRMHSFIIPQHGQT